MKDDSVRSAAMTVPSPRQMMYEDTEFNALISYGLPPFTGVQFGSGFTSPEMFWPEALNVDQWADTVFQAGMKGIILTCKHYDGFCLWPTKMTDYSVKASKWLDGCGDLVREVSDACHRKGLRFGVYVSPWDRHEETYGKGAAYDEFFLGLLRELLTNYGDIFCVWLDGACGGDTEQDYNWEAYYKLIRQLQPGAAIAFSGPDIRWCGNERGVVRANEWSCIPAFYGVDEDGSADKAHAPARKAKAGIMELDLGSRKAIKGVDSFVWYPCEVNVPMREHWFYNADDKYSVKTKDKLFKLYCSTVGGNANLLLGLSPDKRGQLDDTDIKILQALGSDLHLYFGYNLADRDSKCVDSSSMLSELYRADNVRNDRQDSYWRPAADDKKPQLIIEFNKPETFDRIVIKERIKSGQHIEKFSVYCETDGHKRKKMYEGGVIGHKKIICLRPTEASKVIIEFNEFREFMEIQYLGIN